MADYTAEELVSPGAVATVGSPVKEVTLGSIVSGANVATVGSSVSVVRVQDLVAVRPKLYRFRGYYVGGSTYEFWTGVSLDTPNPSGNPLINKVVDSVLL